MYYDSVEQLVALAGINGAGNTGETHLDEINPRKMARLSENVRRADYNDGLNIIYNQIRAGNIDTPQFKDLIAINEAKLKDES